MPTFAWPWVFLALPLPWLVRRFLPAATGEGRSALRVPFFDDVVTLADNKPGMPGRYWRGAWLSWLAWLLLVAAGARPQWVGEPVALPVSGRDVMLAVDISGSMARADFTVSGRDVTRLDVVKDVAGRFIERRVGDRIGLILFGTQAYLQTPLTFDRTTVATMLDEAEVGLAGKETAIGDAIGLAIKRLQRQEAEHRLLILLTDGANTAGETAPRQAAALAAAEGLRIYAIGIGAGPRRVRSFFGSRLVNPSADLDEQTLMDIAEATGGRFFRAKDRVSLEDVYGELDEIEPVVTDTAFFRPRRALFHWPLALALALTVISALWRLAPVVARKTRAARAEEVTA